METGQLIMVVATTILLILTFVIKYKEKQLQSH